MSWKRIEWSFSFQEPLANFENFCVEGHGVHISYQLQVHKLVKIKVIAVMIVIVVIVIMLLLRIVIMEIVRKRRIVRIEVQVRLVIIEITVLVLVEKTIVKRYQVVV